MRCSGTTLNGSPCKLPARKGLATCRSHSDQEEEIVAGMGNGHASPGEHNYVVNLTVTLDCFGALAQVRQLRDNVEAILKTRLQKPDTSVMIQSYEMR